MERYSTPINEDTVYAMFSPFFRDEPTPEPVQNGNGAHNGGKRNFDALSFLNSHGVRIIKQEPHNGGVKLILDHCVFDESHRGKDAAVFIGSEGKIGYHCFHNSCAGKTWKDVRRLLDPAAYDRRSDHARPRVANESRLVTRSYDQIQEEQIHAERTLKRAKRGLRVRSELVGKQWVWSLASDMTSRVAAFDAWNEREDRQD